MLPDFTLIDEAALWNMDKFHRVFDGKHMLLSGAVDVIYDRSQSRALA